MANNANAVLSTNFNVSPYYDDYDEGKLYYRMLFKPGYAVQARELTQMQTMLQKQVDRFGKHVFREGSIVLPGEFFIENELDYVKIRDVDVSNNTVNLNDYVNTTLTGQTNEIAAYVVNVLDGTETDANTKTLYIRYQSGSNSNTSIKTFVANEVLVSNTLPNLRVLSSNPVGKASRFLIREGVFFAKEHFIKFDTQSIIISRYTTTPSCRIGFKIIEQIVNASMDTSLLDPALEASNYYAPGADRLKLIPELQIRDISDETGIPEFVELLTIQNGIVTERYDRSQYNILRDEMAKRTEDESGDYYVRGLNVRMREFYDTGVNGGLTIAGNSNYLSVGVEPGTAYVKGYEINKLVTDYVNVPKAIDYANVSTQIGSTVLGSYVTLTQFSGAPVADKGSQITLYDNAARSIVNKTWGTQPSGNAIGTARIASFEYNSESLGQANASVLLYITDIKMTGSNTFSNVRSVFLNNAGVRTNLVGDVLLNSSNNAILNDVRSGALLYPVGSTAVKTVRNSSGNPSLQFNFLRTSDVTITGSTGTFTVSLATSGDGETYPYGTSGALSARDKREIFLTLNQSANILGSGTVTANGGVGNTTTLTGVSTAFTRFNVGDKFQVAGRTDTAANTFTIAQITSDTSLKTIENLPAFISGNAIFKVYKAGDMIDLTTVGKSTGLERLVSTTPTLLTFNLRETFTSDLSATVTYQVVRTGAQEIQKLLRPSRYIKINVASHSTGTNGPYTLGYSDIYRVKKIIKKSGSFPASLTDGTDVTNQFTVDNGQRDMFYDHGSITPNIRLSTNDRLLVELDYFEPSYAQGKGYFSIDSYPINDNTVSSTTIRTEDIPFFVSPRDKSLYNLRNYIDVRPIKTLSVSDILATDIATAPTNPAVSTTFNFESNGLRLPVPSTQFNYSFSYYFPRRDLVTIDKDGFVNIVRGIPSNFPTTPATPGNVMALASIFITPYPSLAPNYGRIIKRPDLACVIKKLSNIRFTMRDIGLLKQRIENLEYYASLSLLEKSAAEMKILDENGLERFKNGIFVDSFANHELGDVLNPNYRIVVDPEEKTIRPKYSMNSLYYDYRNGTNVRKTGDLITLDYTETLMHEQNVATSFRNVELTSYRFLGQLLLNPETDVWVDTEYAPDEHIFQGDEVANSTSTTSTTEWGSWQTTWNSWQNQVSGFQAYNSRGQLVGTYSTFAQAAALFDSDRSVSLTSTSRFIAPTGSQTYGTVTNVYVNGQYYSNYALSPGDGLIYQVTSGTQTGTSTRTGTETFTTTTTTGTSTTETVGTKVVDVSLVPYIRPQIIKIYGRGLKPKTRVYPFFDGEPMYMFARPITVDMFNDVPNASTSAQEGDPLVTDEYGEILLNLRLPVEKPFRVGTKEVILTDSSTNSVDASTKATGFFVAQGLLQEKQNTVLTTRGYTTTTSTETTTVTDSKNVSNTRTTKTLVGFIEDVSCSAYSFVPKAPVGEEGVFLTSVDLFFAAKHPTLGVWCEIREMDNASGITRKQVPFSEVWIPASEIITSEDASLAQKVTFPSPVFLYNDVQYAFIIHTVGINPDTYLWISRLGETNIVTGRQYSARPLTGTFYTTNNNRNWDMVPDIDLKIRFYRANFVTNVLGEAILGNKTTEEVLATTVNEETYEYGEPYVGRYRITLTAGSSVNVVANDIVTGEDSGANNVVANVINNVIILEHCWANTEPGIPPGLCRAQYIQSERLIVRGANGQIKGTTTALASIERAIAKFKKKKQRPAANVAICTFENTSNTTSTNNTFQVGDVMYPLNPVTDVTLSLSGNGSGGTISVTTANTQRKYIVVGEIKNMRYSVVDFEPGALSFNKTTLRYEMRTTSEGSFVLQDYFNISPNENFYFDTERAILSRTNEINYIDGSPSNNVKVLMTSTSPYLSPVIDLGRTHSVFVDNIINSNTYGEIATGVTLRVTGNVANIAINDVLIGANSGGNSSVTFVSGNNVTVTVPSSQFIVGERLTVYDSSIVSKANTTVITDIIQDNKKPGGELINKYISKPITLAEGQDAEDLLVILTAYKPPTTDVKVYVKILHNEDGSSFTNLPWIELETEAQDSYSALSSRNDFIEMRYQFPESSKTGPNGEVQYKNADGVTFTGFKYYAIKIGLLADNSAVVPRVGDLRAIAIQI